MPVDQLPNIVKELKNWDKFRAYLQERIFAHNAAYFVGKHLAKRTVSDKSLKERAYETTINLKFGGYQRGL